MLLGMRNFLVNHPVMQIYSLFTTHPQLVLAPNQGLDSGETLLGGFHRILKVIYSRTTAVCDAPTSIGGCMTSVLFGILNP